MPGPGSIFDTLPLSLSLPAVSEEISELESLLYSSALSLAIDFFGGGLIVADFVIWSIVWDVSFQGIGLCFTH